MIIKQCVLALAGGLLLIAGGGLVPLLAQDANSDRVTVWDGVYTAGQAALGKSHFESSCSSCHDGDFSRPDAFLDDWGEDELDSLFDLISNSMPASAPASLPDQTYLEIVAYLLELNGFPAGDEALVADAMSDIRVEGRDGPGTVPDFSLAAVQGCLARDADGGWVVNSATAPVRTRDPAASTEEELLGMVDTALGTGLFELLYMFPTPDAYLGHKVEVKGFLILEPDPDQMNVSNVTSIAPSC
jgi:hypothetical protein